jgi:hypothetical protein
LDFFASPALFLPRPLAATCIVYHKSASLSTLFCKFVQYTQGGHVMIVHFFDVT